MRDVNGTSILLDTSIFVWRIIYYDMHRLCFTDNRWLWRV